MALHIENPEVVRLAGEVAELAKETKTEAIRRALEERKERLRLRGGKGKREGLEEWREPRSGLRFRQKSWDGPSRKRNGKRYWATVQMESNYRDGGRR